MKRMKGLEPSTFCMAIGMENVRPGSARFESGLVPPLPTSPTAGRDAGRGSSMQSRGSTAVPRFTLKAYDRVGPGDESAAASAATTATVHGGAIYNEAAVILNAITALNVFINNPENIYP